MGLVHVTYRSSSKLAVARADEVVCAWCRKRVLRAVAEEHRVGSHHYCCDAHKWDAFDRSNAMHSSDVAGVDY